MLWFPTLITFLGVVVQHVWFCVEFIKSGVKWTSFSVVRNGYIWESVEIIVAAKRWTPVLK